MAKYCDDTVFPKYANPKMLYKYIEYTLEGKKKTHFIDLRKKIKNLNFKMSL